MDHKTATRPEKVKEFQFLIRHGSFKAYTKRIGKEWEASGTRPSTPFSFV